MNDEERKRNEMLKRYCDVDISSTNDFFRKVNSYEFGHLITEESDLSDLVDSEDG